MSEISKTNWLKGTSGTIILGLITSFIYDFVKEKPILSTISSIFKSIWNFIYQILDTELKIWWILLVVIVIKIFQKVSKEYSKSKKPSLPDNLKNYVKDDFTNWNWKWEWNWDGDKNKWVIKSLWPYCKKCDIKLLIKSSVYDSAMECPKCKTRFESIHRETDDYDGVKAVIYDNVEKNRM
ncbi:hypothetical protein [Maribacter arcticus]|uniref:hypothetical protein n=1 Tax=Maribacter arcticus TaxID=561365 RepID=UPI003002FF17